MSVDLVLNELSWPSASSDVWEARKMMSSLIQVILEANRIGVQRQLRTKANIVGAELVRGYPLAKWRNDGAVDEVERKFFSGVITKAPYIGEGESDRAARERSLLSDYRFLDQPADGLGAAHLLGSIAVSFQSNSVWNCSQCLLDATLFEDDELVNERVSIPHASASEHMRGHRKLVEQRNSEEIGTGRDVWNRRTELFPRLIFCNEVERQLDALNERQLLTAVVDRLYDLENFCRSWKEGGFSLAAFPCKATPEAEATLKEYGESRTFTCPEKGRILFSWHARLTPSAWRMYFEPRPPGRLCIGYIGPHLPTKKFPN